MSRIRSLLPFHEMILDHGEILFIKRNELVFALDDPYKLNHYADTIVQEQSLLLQAVDSVLTLELSQTIEKLISALVNSKKHLNKRKFNTIQKWLGIDIEYESGQLEYYKNIDLLLDRANHLSQKLQLEIHKSQERFKKLIVLREQMFKYIVAAEEFLLEYPKFAGNVHPLDNFSERLSKKINMLYTLQASNDLVITQMQVSEQLAFVLIDRFKEAQQVLIPTWQYHVKLCQQSHSTIELEKLDNSRENLIKNLKKSLENNID